jgi:hypothetical protein
MKTIRQTRWLMTLLLLSSIAFYSCKDSGPKDLNIVSLMVGEQDLNAAVSPENVPVSTSIVVTFNTVINPTTVSPATVQLIQDYDGADVELDLVVDRTVLTITPKNNLGSGALYRLELRSGMLNDDDQPLGSTTRTFKTAGTFSPPGLVAYWNFEGNADDKAGNFTPPATGVVDVTYTPGRNTQAGLAATFNGTTSIIEIPNGDQLINTNDFTLSFWVKTNSEGINRGHFVIGLGAFWGLQYEIFGNYDGAKFALRYLMANGETTGEDMWFPAEATDNTTGGWMGWDYARSLTPDQMIAMLKDTWLHVTLTYNSATKKTALYYNGEIMKSFDFNLWPEDDAKRTVTGMVYGGTAPDVVNELAFGFIQSRAGTLWANEPWGGYRFPDANHFKGQLDDIKIYHKPLTANEIRLMYESER